MDGVSGTITPNGIVVDVEVLVTVSPFTVKLALTPRTVKSKIVSTAAVTVTESTIATRVAPSSVFPTATVISYEPTAGLDPEERNRFNNLLSEIGENIIVILSTHLVEDVRNLCTKMAIINKGQLLLCGNPEEFITQINGKIWKKNIDKNELSDYQSKYKIISTQLQASKLSVKVFSNENPNNGFMQSVSDLEDVYFTTLLKLQ